MEYKTHTSPQHLRRNTSEGKIAGVAAGIGDYFGIDPVVIRLVFVLLVFAGGFGALAYLIAWLVIPPRDESQPISPQLQRRLPGSRWNWRAIIGGVALTVGLIAFLGSAGAWWLPDIEAWPIILIVIGAGLLLLRRRDEGEGPPAVPPEQRPPPETPTVVASAVDSNEVTPTESGDDAEAASDSEAASDQSTEPPAAAPATDQTTHELGTDWPEAAPSSVEEPPGPRPVRKRLPIGWATLGIVVAGAALAGLLDTLDIVDVSAQVFLIGALIATGIGLVASAFAGRPLGLVFLTLGVASALGVATLIDNASLRSGAGDRTVRVASISELDDRYELSAGKLTLDLRELDLVGQEATLEADVGVGELVLIFSPDVNAEIAGSASIGEVELFGRSAGGVSVEQTARLPGFTRRVRPSDYPGGFVPPGGWPRLEASTGRLVVDAGVGIGKLEARLAS